MSFTAKDVQALRQATGAGMMDCKKALETSNGDMEAAKQWLREKGLAKVAKLGDRENAQGSVCAVVDGQVGAIVQLKSETDFSAKADDFTFNALRPPKTETRSEEGDDPDAKVLEKMYLIEKCAGFFDALYTQFLNTRLSQGWTGELSDFADWLREGV